MYNNVEGDKMIIFNTILLDFILLTFPIILYFIYNIYAKTLDKDKKNLYLDCALFTSCYLLFKFGNLSYKNIPIFIFDIPLLIAYLNNKKTSFLILSIVLIIFYYNKYNIPIIICFIEYIFYYLIYKVCKNKKLDEFIFTNIFIITKSCMLFIYIMLSEKYIINNNMIISFLIVTILFAVISNFIIDIYIKLKNIIMCYNQVEDTLKEKRIQNSLFKITHEIKNPVAVCKGYLDMFDVDNLEHSRKFIPILKSEINRILYLLEDFLSISKIKLEKEEMDLNMLLEDTVDCLKPILDNKNIDFISNITDDEIYINGDYNRLKQTLVNVIKNSKEAIIEKGTIKLYTDLDKKWVKIYVEDTGIGMTEDELKKIKEAFFTTKGNGTGLGTYLANEIISSHGGKLEYISKKNIGTKVIISLPV